MQRHIFFGPTPWGPGEGPKGQILLNIIKFLLQSQFQRFLNQTLCVFSQMKDIKHIRRDFHSLALVMPKGSDLGVQCLCVFSQLKDMKHIRRDFHSVAWVMPQGWDLGAPWGVGGSKNFFSQIQPDLVCELLT